MMPLHRPPLVTGLARAADGRLIDVSDVRIDGVLDAEGKSFPARSVYLMSKSAIAQKNAKEAEMWRTRGIAGKVTAVNAQTNQITVEVRGLMGTTSTEFSATELAWEFFTQATSTG